MATSKLPPDQLLICLKSYAQGNTPASIYKYLVSNNIPRPNIPNFYAIFKSKANQKIIKEERDKYMASINDVPIMNKRIRADKLQLIYNKLESTIENKLIDKNNGTLKISKESFKRINELLKRINEILVLARDEMEKRPGTVIQFFDNETTLEELLRQEKAIDEQLLSRRSAGLSIAAIGEGPVKEAETSDDKPESA